jgi:tetratricopeptide (TPR) repeat protein
MNDPLIQRAIRMHHAGQVAQALEIYNQVLAWQPVNDHLLYMAGMANLQLGQTLEGMRLLQHSLGIKQDNAPAHNNYGRALQSLGELEKALQAYDTALRVKPDYAEPLFHRGVVLADLHRPEEALESYDRAIALMPNFAEAHAGRGLALRELRRPAEALAAYDRSLALKPNQVDVHNSRGVVLQEMTRLNEALAAYERAIALKPDYAKAHLNKAYICLLKGDLAKGWELLEWRFTQFKSPFAQAHWTGKESLEGKTVLVHADEGIGDAIMFARYAGPLRDLGTRVVLEVQKPIATLLKSLDGAAEVIARGEPRPAFDFHLPMLSLPHALRETVKTVPQSASYLTPDPALVQQWQPRMATSKLKVGLAWAGGTHFGKTGWGIHNEKRNVPLELLSRSLNGVDAEFYSLQVGAEAEAELAARHQALWPRGNLHNFMAENRDFSDSAAIIANLDVVISVDTSVVHVAAALGKPVWVLLGFAHDWRWLQNRDDSYWYPSVKLYRQGADLDWTKVLARVAADLGNFKA